MFHNIFIYATTVFLCTKHILTIQHPFGYLYRIIVSCPITPGYLVLDGLGILFVSPAMVSVLESSILSCAFSL